VPRSRAIHSLTRLPPVPKATRTPRACGRCASFKGHSFSVAPCQTQLVRFASNTNIAARHVQPSISSVAIPSSTGESISPLQVKAFAGSAVITTILGSYLAMGEFFSEMLCGRSTVLACTSDECNADWDTLGSLQPEPEPDRFQFPAALRCVVATHTAGHSGRLRVLPRTQGPDAAAATLPLCSDYAAH
jgi:hypothetical protein